MWGTVIRGFGSWIARNWAGLSAGYVISDIFGYFGSSNDQPNNSAGKSNRHFGVDIPGSENPVLNPGRPIANWFSEFWKSLTSWNIPVWVPALGFLYVLYLFYSKFSNNKK